MNKILIPLIICCVAFVQCKSDDDTHNDPSQADAVSDLAKEGTWNVSYYFDTDQDETSAFAGFSFNFQDGGVVAASNDLLSVTGTWSVSESSDGTIDFTMNFPPDSTGSFSELSDDWDVVSSTSSQLELSDESGGNGGTDFLTFEKN